MIGRFHCQAVKAIDDAALVGVCDVVDDRAHALAREFEATEGHFTSVGEMARADGLDVVVVGVPSGLHHVAALAAIDAGKHVVVEKPIDITLERADRMIEAARDAGVLLSVISQKRFEPATRHLKEAVDSGKFGRIAFADVYVKWWRTPEYYSQGGWKGTKDMDGGGALINQSVHQIDLLRWIMGPVRTLFGRADARVHDIEAEDTAAAVLEFESGAMGVIQGSTASYPGHPATLSITGERGSARIEDGTLTEWSFAGEEHLEADVLRRFAGVSGSGGGDPASINARGHELQFRDVIEALRTGRPPLTDGHEGRKALELILAIYESSETGLPVRLTGR
jgi:predicted dehydrogenase